MKIVLVSNYFNHHQQALCRALDARNPGDFYFIATSEMRAERKALGYGGWEIPGYVRTAHTGEADMALCRKLISEADVVIAGSAPESMIAPRIQSGKLTFRYQERPWKTGLHPLKYLPKWIQLHMLNPGNKPVYLLGAGAFTAKDYARFGLFRRRAYRWGYFPETKHYDMDALLQKKASAEILWAGRFLDWKHPEYALEAARRLKNAGCSFRLDMIGTGPMEEQLKQWVREWDLEDRVYFLGSMKPAEVRARMERAGIFLFTSNKQEGWGAVLNESMNSGCAVVASHAIGSAPDLIRDGENGLVYRSGDVDMLAERIICLLNHPEIQAKLGRAAYDTISGQWNAETAAKRLCELSACILAGEKYPMLFENGPCSPAELIDDNWY